MINILMNDLEDEIRRKLLRRTQSSALRQGRDVKKGEKSELKKFLNIETGGEYTEIIFYSCLADIRGNEGGLEGRRAPVSDSTPLPIAPLHTAPRLRVGHSSGNTSWR